MKNSYLFDRFVIALEVLFDLVEVAAVKRGQLVGNGDTWMPIFSADTLDLLVTDIFLEEEIIHFFW